MARRLARPQGTVVVVATFALLSLVPVIGLGLLLGKVVNTGVQQENLTAANKTAVIIAQTGIQPLLTPSDLTTGLSETRRADLDTRLHAVAFGHVIARLKIWNRQNVVVYSDNPSLIGKAFPADDNLERALAGHAASEISDATAGGSRAGGTGLGLPLSRRLIELMGGELVLLSSSPSGSTFRIRIHSGTQAEVPSAEPVAGVLSR